MQFILDKDRRDYGMLRISIITVCYNVEKKIKLTIDSVLAQTYHNIEYLIIDGASTDNTLEVLQTYLGRNDLLIYCENDFGIYNAMNRGIARATGDYLFFLNAGDTFYDDHVLENIVSNMEGDPNAIYYGNVCTIYPDGSKVISNFEGKEGTLENKLLDGEMPCHQSIFAPRSTLTDHYFREKFLIRADYEWLMYSVCNGKRCVYIPLIISNYDTSGISGRVVNRKLFWKETQSIIDEYREKINQCNPVENWVEQEMKWKNLSDKHFFLFQLMNYWLELKQAGINIATYFEKHGYQRIAIYGISCVGLRLYDELKNSSIKIEYAIDKNAEKVLEEIEIVKPNEITKKVDAVIVTAITYFDEIKEQIKGEVDCPIISLEDIIFEILQKIADYE